MTSNGTDKRAISKLMKNMQKEFDRHSIRVPVEAEPGTVASAGTTINNGPVFNGSADGVQLAWENQHVHQEQNQTTPGFEALADLIRNILQELPHVGLEPHEQQETQEAAHAVLHEVTQPEPDHGTIRKTLLTIKGALSSLATGLVTGASDGAQEWAKTTIEQIGAATS